MKIIASKFGSHFGYLFRRNRRKIRMFFTILIIILFFIYITLSIRNHFMPLAYSMAESKAKSVGTVIINEAITKQITMRNLDYSTLYNIQKNSSGDISAITANVAKMNTIKAQLSTEIQEKINKIETQQIGIPLGSMLNNELLAGRGPNIPIKLVTVGVIEIDFTNTFESAGINQTKLEVQLEIKTTVSAMLPTGNARADIFSTVPIAQTIIVGNVPDAYTNIDF